MKGDGGIILLVEKIKTDKKMLLFPVFRVIVWPETTIGVKQVSC
jgi:hypothetical protein